MSPKQPGLSGGWRISGCRHDSGGIRLPDAEHGTLGQFYDLFGDRTEQQVAPPRFAPSRHHDHVDVVVLYRLQ